MRVALDATYSVDPQPSGIAVYSRQLLNELARLYPEHDFFHCYRLKQFKKAPASGWSNVRRRLLLPPLHTFRAKVFHALNQRVDRRPSPRVVSTFHDLFVMTGEYSTPDFRARFTRQARKAADSSDLIIAVSTFTATQVCTLLGVERSRVRVIHHGIEQPADFASERRKLVLFVGALQARKNLIRLIEAFETMPNDWQLVLAGAGTGFRAKEILRRIEQSHSRGRIRLTGYVSRQEKQELFSSASIFAFPSLDEGFGIPVLEAMAWGVPVITSDGSALSEIARGAAILVDPHRTEDIAQALNGLASTPALAQELILKGKLRAAQFTWERAACETFAVYTELVG